MGNQVTNSTYSHTPSFNTKSPFSPTNDNVVLFIPDDDSLSPRLSCNSPTPTKRTKTPLSYFFQKHSHKKERKSGSLSDRGSPSLSPKQKNLMKKNDVVYVPKSRPFSPSTFIKIHESTPSLFVNQDSHSVGNTPRKNVNDDIDRDSSFKKPLEVFSHHKKRFSRSSDTLSSSTNHSQQFQDIFLQNYSFNSKFNSMLDKLLPFTVGGECKLWNFHTIFDSSVDELSTRTFNTKVCGYDNIFIVIITNFNEILGCFHEESLQPPTKQRNGTTETNKNYMLFACNNNFHGVIKKANDQNKKISCIETYKNPQFVHNALTTQQCLKNHKLRRLIVFHCE
ncbi:hypothetical protein QTN25_009249 [Entamoeba marina]